MPDAANTPASSRTTNQDHEISREDLEQTHGEPLPDVTPVLARGRRSADLWDGLAFQVDGEGYRLRRGECARPTANGETDPMTKTVTVRADLPPAQACKTLAHELAHIRLGHVTGLPSSSGCRGVAEVEAESVAYMVSAEAGLDTSHLRLRPVVVTATPA
jgi:hypothetical protein